MKKAPISADAALHAETHASYLLSISRHNWWMLLTPFLALLGLAGTMASLLTLYQPSCSTPWVLLTSGGIFLLAGGLQYLKRTGGIWTAAIVLGILALVLLRGSLITTGLQYLINTIYENAYHTEIAYFQIKSSISETESVSFLLCCVGGLLACFFSYFTIRRPQFLLPALLSFLLLEPGLYLGLPLVPIAAAPLLAYWCGMLSMRLILRRTLPTKAIQNTAAICGTGTALATAALYTLLVLLGTWTGYTRSEADWERKRNLSQSFSNLQLPSALQNLGSSLGLYHDPDVSQLGTKNKLEFEGKPVLSATFDTLPQSAVYLKGYTGSEYRNNCWYPLDEAESNHDQSTVTQIIKTYDCAPQNFAFLFQRSFLPQANLIQCTIQLEQKDNRYYAPYDAYSDTAAYSNDAKWEPSKHADSYSWTISQPQEFLLDALNQAPLEEYTFSQDQNSSNDAVSGFLHDLGITENTIPVNTRFPLTQAATVPSAIEGKVIPAAIMESTLYRDFAKASYLQIPKTSAMQKVYDALPESILSRRNPTTAAGQYEALNAIRKWMASTTTYTTEPGKTPGNRDFTAFFLLENQKGYCVHYATAGTILARYLGIPARYCEGYLIGSDVLQKASQTKITVTDKQSHAWCEFYIDGYGWVPFEMTPGYYDPDVFAQNAQVTPPQTTTTTAPAVTQTTTVSLAAGGQQSSYSLQSSGTTSVTTTRTKASTDDTQKHHSTLSPVFWILPVLLLCIAGVWFSRFFILRRRSRCIRDISHPKQAVFTAYHTLLRLLQLIGIPYHGQLLLEYQEEAEKALAERHLPTEAVQLLIPLTLSVDMGQKTPSAAEIHQAAAALEALQQAVSSSCNPFRRFFLKYLHHLC